MTPPTDSLPTASRQPTGSFWSNSAIILVAANLVPLVGAALADWNVWFILFLYWLENVGVGIITACKILLSTGQEEHGAKTPWGTTTGPGDSRRSQAASFFFNYGIFTAAHGFFVFALGGFIVDDPAPLDARGLNPWVTLLTAVCLLGGDFYRFYASFICRGEGSQLSPSEIARQPMARMVVLHTTIILGMMAVVAIGSPSAIIAVLVALKTAAELHWLHRDQMAAKSEAVAHRPRRRQKSRA